MALMQHVSRRAFVSGSAAGFGGFLATACSRQPQAGTPAGGEQATRRPVTLRLNYRNETYIPERAKDFSQAYPWITVETIPDSGYEKLIVLLAAGDLGDIIWLSTGVGTFFEFASLGHLMALDDLVNRDKYDLKQFYPRAIDTARFEGKLYGLPSLLHPSHLGLFYNVNLFELSGVRPPSSDWTLDDLVETARKLTVGDTKGIETETAYPPVLVWLRTFGGEFLDPPYLGRKPALDRPQALQALQFLFDLRHRYRVNPIKGQENHTFTNGNVAMRQSLMSNYARFPQQIGDRFKIDCVLLPKGPTGKRGSQGHVDMWGMYSKTKYRDEAWELHKWFGNKDTAMRLAGLDQAGIPGARPDAWNDPQVVNRPMFKVFKDFVEKEGPDVLALPWNLRMLDWQRLNERLLDPIWTGTQPVNQLVSSIMGELQTFLDQPRPQ